MLSHGKFTNKLMSSWMKWTYYDLQGKSTKMNSNVDSTKTFDDIEPHKTHCILLQTSLDPSMLYSSYANALS